MLEKLEAIKVYLFQQRVPNRFLPSVRKLTTFEGKIDKGCEPVAGCL